MLKAYGLKRYIIFKKLDEDAKYLSKKEKIDLLNTIDCI